MAVTGARACLLLPSLAASSSPRPRLLALPPRHRRPRGSLASSAAGGRGQLRVRMARTESTGVAVGFRAPQFEVCRSRLVFLAVRFEPDAGVLGCSLVFVVGVQLPEPLTWKLWPLDGFKGNPALLVGHSFCISCAKCI